MEGSSIWTKEAHSYSCASPDGIRGDTGFACAGDGTSIMVDMNSTSRKLGCFVWATPDCQYPMRNVWKIEFDVEWTGCENLWMAPIWTFSYPWAPITGRQGVSGEIDFVEGCQLPAINTNLGCYNAYQGEGCRDSTHWGEGETSGGIKHMVMGFDGADLLIDVCNGTGVSSGPSCKRVGHYMDYLNIVYPTTDGRDNLYSFMSDIFNDEGGPGDGGWCGCKARRNYNTNCKYAVTKLKIRTRTNSKIFAADSKCAPLDAEPTPGPHPGPAPPAPVPTPKPVPTPAPAPGRPCQAGDAVCCDPNADPKQVCPGGVACPTCSGDACACPGGNAARSEGLHLPMRSATFGRDVEDYLSKFT